MVSAANGKTLLSSLVCRVKKVFFVCLRANLSSSDCLCVTFFATIYESTTAHVTLTLRSTFTPSFTSKFRKNFPKDFSQLSSMTFVLVCFTRGIFTLNWPRTRKKYEKTLFFISVKNVSPQKKKFSLCSREVNNNMKMWKTNFPFFTHRLTASFKPIFKVVCGRAREKKIWKSPYLRCREGKQRGFFHFSSSSALQTAI